MAVSGDDVGVVSVDLDLLEIAERLEERACVRSLEGRGAEPLAELIWPSRAVGMEVAAADFASASSGSTSCHPSTHWSGLSERDLVSCGGPGRRRSERRRSRSAPASRAAGPVRPATSRRAPHAAGSAGRALRVLQRRWWRPRPVTAPDEGRPLDRATAVGLPRRRVSMAFRAAYAERQLSGRRCRWSVPRTVHALTSVRSRHNASRTSC